MIDVLIHKYDQYEMKYSPRFKTLYIYTPMLVKDYVELKMFIKDWELDIENIILEGERNKLHMEREKFTIYPW